MAILVVSSRVNLEKLLGMVVMGDLSTMASALRSILCLCGFRRGKVIVTMISDEVKIHLCPLILQASSSHI